jgi:hypothetical protein
MLIKNFEEIYFLTANPATRSLRLANWEKNLGNLILKCFTEEQEGFAKYKMTVLLTF